VSPRASKGLFYFQNGPAKAMKGSNSRTKTAQFRYESGDERQAQEVLSLKTPRQLSQGVDLEILKIEF